MTTLSNGYYRVVKDGKPAIAEYEEQFSSFRMTGDITYYDAHEFDSVEGRIELREVSFLTGYTVMFPPVGLGGYNRVAVIKAVRRMTNLGLREAKLITETGKDEVLTPYMSIDNKVLSEAIEVMKSHGVVFYN